MLNNQIEDFIRKNGEMSVREISEKLNVPRHKIDNIVFSKKLLIRRVKCSAEEMADRLKFIRANLHLTQRELSAKMNLTHHIVRNMCRVHKLKTARRWVSSEEQAERLVFMRNNPDFTKQQFAEKMGISESTVYRMLWSEGLKYRKIRKKGSEVVTATRKQLRVPRKNFMNRFLMGK